MESTEIIKRDAPSCLPVFGGEAMTKAFGAYRELQASLDKAMPDQIMMIQNKHFRKKGYWRAVKIAFGLRVTCLLEKREEVKGDWGYVVTYRAEAPSGASADGDGACFAAEKSRGRMEATVHNVRAHAHTRAFNRAVSNLVGFGEVSAEEAIGEDGEARRRPGSTMRPVESKPEEKPSTGNPGTITDADKKEAEHRAEVAAYCLDQAGGDVEKAKAVLKDLTAFEGEDGEVHFCESAKLLKGKWLLSTVRKIRERRATPKPEPEPAGEHEIIDPPEEEKVERARELFPLGGEKRMESEPEKAKRGRPPKPLSAEEISAAIQLILDGIGFDRDDAERKAFVQIAGGLTEAYRIAQKMESAKQLAAWIKFKQERSG